MRRRLSLLLLIVAALAPAAFSQPLVRIQLSPADRGYIVHVEHVPHPSFKASDMLVSDVALQLLEYAVYGKELPGNLLDYIYSCYSDGMFSQRPGEPPNAMATFYASLLARQVGLKFALNLSKVRGYVNDSSFYQAFFSSLVLSLYGERLQGLEGFQLQDGSVSLVRGARIPNSEATALWYIFLNDSSSWGWLEKHFPFDTWPGKLRFLYYFTRRPVYVNATIFPLVVVNLEPRPVKLSALRWPGEPVNASYSFYVENGTVVSVVSAGGRVLKFRHEVAREEHALVTLKSERGAVVVEAEYRPPYVLRLDIGGIKLEWVSDQPHLQRRVELPIYGVLKVTAEIVSEDILLRGCSEIRLEAGFERSLLDYAAIAVPGLVLLVFAFSVHRRKRKKILPVLVALQAAPAAFTGNILLEVHPLWITLAYSAALLAAIFALDRKAFWRAVDHAVPLALLAAAAMILESPAIIILAGIGAAFFLATAVKYPSERSKVESLYRTIMLLYSISLLASGFLIVLSVPLAQMAFAPDAGFIDSVRIQAEYVADLIMLMPVLSGIYVFGRAVFVFKRAKAAEEMIRDLTKPRL